jgi:ribosomal protein L32
VIRRRMDKKKADNRKACAYCGKYFIPTRASQKYDSPSCYWLDMKAQRQKVLKGMVEIVGRKE